MSIGARSITSRSDAPFVHAALGLEHADAPTDVEVTNPPGLSGPPRSMDDWRMFVRVVAIRYRARSTTGRYGTGQLCKAGTEASMLMVQMARDAYTILARSIPSAVVSPALPGTAKGVTFLDSYLRQRWRAVCRRQSVLSLLRRRERPARSDGALINSVKAVMAKHGLASKPLWDTETGWLGNTLLPPDTAAAWLARAGNSELGRGRIAFYWCTWESQHSSQIELVGPDNAAHSPGRELLSPQSRSG